MVSRRQLCVDDTFNQDLSTGFRSRNDAIQGNVFYTISRGSCLAWSQPLGGRTGSACQMEELFVLNRRSSTSSSRPLAHRPKERQHPIQRFSAGRIVQVELVLMRKRRGPTGRKEECLDPDAELRELPCERNRLGRERIAIAARDESGWERLRDVARDRHQPAFTCSTGLG